jgi:hypothetical protein
VDGRYPCRLLAAITAVEIWGGGKLPGVFVSMAVGAALELDLEQGVFALRDVHP